MSMKSEFRFEFPKKGTEYKALANPMHIEQVTAIVMSERNADLCIVYLDDYLQFICRYVEHPHDGEPHFQFYYRDKAKQRELYLLVGENETSVYMEGGMDAVLENINLTEGENIVNRRLYSTEEADAFVQGVDTVMSMTGREDEYAFITEDDYLKWREKVNEK